MADERENKPSASSASRWVNCPASFKRCSGLPEESSAAEEGTMLHKICELLNKGEGGAQELCAALDAEQSKAIDRAIAVTDGELYILEGEDYKAEQIYERRLWSKSGLFSGQADALFVLDNKATIIDYKFGRGEVDSADCNWQLAALAVLVSDNFPNIESVRACIVQPRALDKDRRFTAVEYSRGDIDAARRALDAAAKTAMSDGAPAKCGAWCKYCKFASQCPEARAELEAVAKTAESFEITPENAADTFRKIKVLQGVLDAMMAKIKALASAQDVPGLKWVDGAKRAKLAYAQKVFEFFAQIISAEKFLGAVKVEKGKLEKLYVETVKAMEPERPKAEISREFNAMLNDGGLVEYEQNAPTLALED